MMSFLQHGLLHLSIWGYVIATLLMTHLSVVATTIYLHRSQAHRALDLHPAVSHFFRFWLWLTTATNTKEWVSVHRKHHAKCETAEDPHSPQIYGIKKVFFEGAELYLEEAKNKETSLRYGQGTPDDWMERNVYIPFKMYGIFLTFAVDILLFGVPGITVWAVQMLWLPLWSAGVINGIGHYWGYRNFECDDAARNIFPWSILTAGEELHNNHHTFASSAKLSVKWWEIDLGWGYICLLRAFKLAKVKRIPPKLKVAAVRSLVDLDTLKTVVANRFQVMAHYSRDVLVPVLREEQRKASVTGQHLMRRCKVMILRAEHMLDDAGKQHVAKILENNHAIQLAYQYRQKLQAIWGRTTASQRELLDALQEWCKEAEATGVKALQNFVKRIHSYSATQNTAG